MGEETRQIAVGDGKYALVDADVYERLCRFNWFLNSKGYAMRWGERADGRPCKILMHREIAGTPPGMQTDHRNGNKLDNLGENLRHATGSQNQANTPTDAQNTSGYKGVHWNTRRQKWVAEIKVNGMRHHLGVFGNPIQAAQAYNLAAKRFHGEFAWLNPVPECTEADLPEKRKSQSRYKGVCLDKARGRWMAWIRLNGKDKRLGRFHSEDDAARAYNEAALAHFGPDAKVNQIPPAA